MAGAESSEKPVLSLRLLVDKKKSKVVLAETGKEFVDVLFSFLTLPMGTIVRLLEKYHHDQKSQAITIGCFNNLYKSVSDLATDNFLSAPCKEMLLYPLNVKEKECKRLKLSVDDTVLKYYGCPSSGWNSSCQLYSNFSSSRCNCGELMGKELNVHKIEGSHEIFYSNKNLFTITERMEVRFTTLSLTLKTLQDLGYTDTDQLQEMNVDVDHAKVLDLLLCLFCSDTPLTDVFLSREISLTNPNILSLQEAYAGIALSDKKMSISVFTRKLDKKILYVESGKDFVDLLFTFLALPLCSAWKKSGSNIVLGSITNLCESFKSCSAFKTTFTESCMLPLYYRCQQELLSASYLAPESILNSSNKSFKPMDPRCTNTPNGFVKEGKTFMISDGLIITPTDLTSNFCQLKKWNLKLDDIEEQVIDITKTEAIKLLRACFMTSTALNTVFGSLLPKKPKQEKL